MRRHRAGLTISGRLVIDEGRIWVESEHRGVPLHGASVGVNPQVVDETELWASRPHHRRQRDEPIRPARNVPLGHAVTTADGGEQARKRFGKQPRTIMPISYRSAAIPHMDGFMVMERF